MDFMIVPYLQRNEIILGINSEADLVKQGTNSNVRLLTYSNESIKQESSHATIASRDPEEYQKITTFSRTGSMVAVGSSKSQVGSFALRQVWCCNTLMPLNGAFIAHSIISAEHGTCFPRPRLQ